jgi:hypothetical protein
VACNVVGPVNPNPNKEATPPNFHWYGYVIFTCVYSTIIGLVVYGDPTPTPALGVKPRLMVTTGLFVHAVAVTVQIRVPVETGAVVPNPQSVPVGVTPAVSKDSPTARAIARTVGGMGLERSAVGWFDPTRAPSRAALLSFCFSPYAWLKSKMPISINAISGRDTANSTICEPDVSDEAARQIRFDIANFAAS